MPYQEKQAYLSMISTTLILLFYSLIVYQKYIAIDPELLNDFKFWGLTFFILIPVTIVIQIILHILFAIANKIVNNEDGPTFNDERDKLIELKSIRVSHWTFTMGFFLAMGTLVIEMEVYVLFIALISSGFIASIASDITKIILYRRGF